MDKGNIFDAPGWSTGLSYPSRVSTACIKAVKDDHVTKITPNDYDLVILSLYFNDCFLSILDNYEVSIVPLFNFFYFL